MAKTINVEVVTKLKTEAQKLGGEINKSNLPTDKKNIATAKLSEALNILERGANITGQELNRVGAALRNVVSELVKASAGEKGVSKELQALQKKLEAQINDRNAVRQERNSITKSKIKKDEDGVYQLRTTEADRLTQGFNVTGARGSQIKTFKTLQKEASSGTNSAAEQAIAAIAIKQDAYVQRLTELDKILPDLNTKVDKTVNSIKQLGDQGDPSQSAAVAMQQFGNELQNLIDEIKKMREEVDSQPKPGKIAPSEDTVDAKAVKKQVEMDLSKSSKDSGGGGGFSAALKQFSIYAIAFRTIKKAFREATSTIKELDKSLTEQAMVTGKTRQQTYSLLKSYQELSLQLGATTKEVSSIATEYMRQGKTTEEALTLTEAAVSAAKVAGISAADSINYLTTALNGFQLSASQAMEVSDKFAAIAANSASSYDEIATALSKVASQANLAGMSIDYTTALLAKGLETTREAPETIGTALKTVIARMRELSDYGETLGGDTTVNNVESQLQYIGISLRDANGELRSSQDVLDELGRKWDTLNSNQQAAIAKALAGTRQQSRLIAMMSDYERVIELEETSRRSSGATMAQMSKYLDSMEAATNNVAVAWEKIISTITNSDALIGIVNSFSKVLEFVNEILSDTGLLLGIGASLAVMGVNYLATKTQEKEIMREQAEIAREQQLLEIEKQIKRKEAQADVSEEKEVQEAENEILIAQEEEALAIAKAKAAAAKVETVNKRIATAEANGNNTGQVKAMNDAELAKANQELAQAEDKVTIATQKVSAAQEKASKVKQQAAQKALKSDKQYNLLINQQNLLLSQNSLKLNMLNGVMTTANSIKKIAISLGRTLQAVGLLIQAVIHGETTAEKAEIIQKRLGIKMKIKNAAATTTEAAAKSAETAATEGATTAQTGLNTAMYACPLVWIIALITAAVAAVAAFAYGIYKLIKIFKKMDDPVEKASKSINKLSAEIYELNEKANSLDKIVDQFDEIDNKILKTNEDLEKTNELLDSAADSLSDEIDEDENIGYGKGISEQAYYKSLTTNKARRDFLENLTKSTQSQIASKRNQQLSIINGLSESNRKRLLASTKAEDISARDAIYGINNSVVYDTIDNLKQQKQLTASVATEVEKLTQNILEQVDAQEALNYANDPGKVENLTKALAQLNHTVTSQDGTTSVLNVSEILGSSDVSLKEQVKTFEQASQALSGDEVALKSFTDYYNQYTVFAKMSDDVLDFIDKVGLSIEDLNELWTGYEKLQKAGINISQEEYQAKYDTFLETLAWTKDSQTQVADSIEIVFGSYLAGMDKSSEEFKTAWNALVSNFSDLISVGILNMGQNIDTLKNTISDFYTKATEWSTMSETDKTEFLSANQELFEGKEGDELLKAFQTGNYERIQEALQNSTTLQNKVEQRLREVEQEIKLETAKAEETQDKAYIQQLRDYKKYLSNTENLFKVSLEVRIEQQEKQLEEYKKLLQSEQNALKDSLDKRKEAYQDYFNKLNDQKEDEDYEKNASILITNLSKLSSSTDATSANKTKELEQKLKELEEKRLETLRSRAQEQILNNLEKYVNQISDQLSKLLENSQALLQAMLGDGIHTAGLDVSGIHDTNSFISQAITNAVVNDKVTALGLQEMLNTLKTTYGSELNYDWDSISSSSDEKGNIILNVSGEEIMLTQDQNNSMYSTIMKALNQMGVR